MGKLWKGPFNIKDPKLDEIQYQRCQILASINYSKFKSRSRSHYGGLCVNRDNSVCLESLQNERQKLMKDQGRAKGM